MKRKDLCESGQDLVEYALILPIFLMIVLVIIDLGRATYYYSTVYNAAREGARYGAIHPDDYAGVYASVRYIAIGLDPTELTVTKTLYDLDGDAEHTDDHVEVKVEYEFRPVTPIVASLLGSEFITLGSRSTMIIEQ